MIRLYIVPAESFPRPGSDTVDYGPQYFAWSSPANTGTGVLPKLGSLSYSFINGFFVVADLPQVDHDALVANADVFVFPIDLDSSILPQDMQALRKTFEDFNIPADWLTPSNTYRNLVQQSHGILVFAGQYAVIASTMGYPQGTFLLSEITLDAQYDEFPVDVTLIFDLTLAYFETVLDTTFPAILPNMTVRQMLKFASDEIKKPLILGGVIF